MWVTPSDLWKESIMNKIRASITALLMFVALTLSTISGASAGTAQTKTNCYYGNYSDVCMTVTYQSANNLQGWSVGRVDMQCYGPKGAFVHLNSPNVKGSYVTMYNGAGVTKWTQTSGISFDCGSGVSFFPSVYAPDANQLNTVYSGSINVQLADDEQFKVKVVLQH